MHNVKTLESEPQCQKATKQQAFGGGAANSTPTEVSDASIHLTLCPHMFAVLGPAEFLFCSHWRHKRCLVHFVLRTKVFESVSPGAPLSEARGELSCEKQCENERLSHTDPNLSEQ